MEKDSFIRFSPVVLISLLSIAVVASTDDKLWHIVTLLIVAVSWSVSVTVNNRLTEQQQSTTIFSETIQAEQHKIGSHIEEILNEETNHLSEHMHRIGDLIAQSTLQLHHSFSTMVTTSTEQADMALELVTRLGGDRTAPEHSEGDLAITDFITKTGEILQHNVDGLVQIDERSIAATYRINEITAELDSIFSSLDDAQQLADQTSALVFNAANEVDSGFAVVADEVRARSKTSASLNEKIREKIQHVKARMDEVNSEVTAIASMDTNSAIEDKATIDKLLTVIESSNKETDTLLRRFTDGSAVMNREINNSIQALQFEDIVSQLSVHVQLRLEHINAVAVFSHSEIANAVDEQELKIVSDKLRQLRDNFHAQNIAQQVEQNTMEEGDIELF